MSVSDNLLALVILFGLGYIMFQKRNGKNAMADLFNVVKGKMNKEKPLFK